MLIAVMFLGLWAAGAVEVKPYKGELVVEQEGDQIRQKFTLSIRPVLEEAPLYLVIQSPDSDEEVIPVYDNGSAGDTKAGDGVYTGVVFRKPGNKQRFFLRGVVKGNDIPVYLEAVLFRF